MQRRLMLTIVGLMLAGLVGLSSRVEGFAVIDDVPVGSPQVRYADPEFDSKDNLITFRDAWLGGNAWVALLHPVTGELIPRSGLGLQIGDHLAPIDELADNGPEWLRDDGVPGVIFTRMELGVERMYIWSAGTGLTTPIIPVADAISRTHFAGSNNPLGSAKILYRRRAAADQPWAVHWLDLADPAVEHELPGVELEVSLPTWIGDDNILFSRQVGDTMQLFRYDTVGLAEHQLTFDAGDKLGAYGWQAPEIGGRLLVLAAIRAPGAAYPHQLGVYYMNRQGLLLSYAMLDIPEEAGTHINITSPEPFVFQGHSYISLGLFNDDRSDASIWVFPVPQPGADTPPAPQRVDDPAIQAMKLDPESYVTADHAFVYYYYSESPGGGHTLLRRCAFLPALSP